MKHTKILFILALGIFLNSCEDAIYIDPQDEITDSNAITNVADIQAAATGTYAFLSGAGEIELSAYISDENKIAPTNNGQGVQINNWTFVDNESDVQGYWSGNYQLVARANSVLTRMGKISAANATEQAALDRVKGEMLGLRALGHFNLLRLFATSYTDLNALAVAYVTRPIVTEKLPRITVGEFYTLLGKDLNDAEALLNANSRTSNGYITSDFVTAIKARIALYRKDYANAFTLSNKLITSGKYKLAQNQSEFDEIWNDGSGDKETIFKVKRLTGQSAIGAIFTATDNATVYLNPSNKLVRSYKSDDLRLTSFLSADKTKVNKYPGTTQLFLNDIKIFRISEMYLIRAEASANTGDLVSASADFNAVAKLRQPAFVDYTFASVNDATTNLLQERFREFAFEGHRFFDLKRTATDITRDSDDCAALQNAACTLPASNFRFTMPIPSAERDVNPGLQQNPGY